MTFLAVIIVFLFVGAYYLIIHRRLQAPKWSLPSANIRIDGMDRQFSYYIPDGISRSPSLVFVLHGSRGSVGIMRYLTNYEFEKIARQKGDFILVYPQGIDRHWNDCRRSATYRAKQENVDDVAFFQAMIDFFVREYAINDQTVFAAGYSNGGHMCLKLAYEIPQAIRGIALFAANNPDLANNDCRRSGEPVSVMIINGTADAINPYRGGLVVLNGDSSRGSVTSSRETMQYWAGLLPGDLHREELVHTDPHIEHIRIKSSAGTHKVELVSVKEGGHTIPLEQPAPYLPGILGATERSLNAPDLVIDFFENLK